MRHVRKLRAAAFTLMMLTALYCMAADNRTWAPVDPQDLKMTEFKAVPGADAVLLAYANEIDDVAHREYVCERIKVLTDSGKHFGTVEIPVTDKASIKELYARTVHPDGSIVEFVGEPFDKVVVKGRGIRVRVKAFTLPQITTGSIIDYRYELHYGDKWLRHHEWKVQHEIYAVKESYLFKYDKRYSIRWLPSPGLDRSPDNDTKAGILKMQAENIAPFESEEQMPPEASYRMRVRFFYTSPYMSSPSSYWYEVGRAVSRYLDAYIGDSKDVRAAASEVIGSETDPVKKLQKLYARAQQIRNLSYERSRTQAEHKKEELKENKNIADVLKHGYGDRDEITRLFVGLAKSSGFTASVVFVSSRESRLFDREVLEFSQLDSEVAEVRLNGKTLLLDPGTRFCPYGIMRWMRTGTAAMNMADPGALVATPGAGPEAAVVSRSAEMDLNSDGSVKGEVRIEFSGSDALERRLAALDTDDAGRKKELEEELKQWLPVNAKVELTQSQGWETENGPLTAIFSVEVPEFASAAGKRLLVPAALFRPRNKTVFKNAPRKYPVYFQYAFTEADSLALKVPEGYSIEKMPSPQSLKGKLGGYSIEPVSTASGLSVQRSMLLYGVFFQPERYEELRNLFTIVQIGDDTQTVLRLKSATEQSKAN
jgi:hypothetical protein